MKTIKAKDIEASNFCVKINKVPKAVKMACLKYFVDKCNYMHALAFFQWRLMFTEDEAAKEELKDIL